MCNVISRSCATRTSRSGSATPRSPRLWLLPCLLALASCAAPPQPLEPETVYECRVDPRLLATTPDPGFQDETLGQLLGEADSLRGSLKQCNADKARAWAVILKQQPKEVIK